MGEGLRVPQALVVACSVAVLNEWQSWHKEGVFRCSDPVIQSDYLHLGEPFLSLSLAPDRPNLHIDSAAHDKQSAILL